MEDKMGIGNEGVVTPDGLEASLEDLLKAGDATDVKAKLRKAAGLDGVEPLVKGNVVGAGGFVDERGHQSGGQSADTGGTYSMMIAKMMESAIAMGVSPAMAAKFAAKMAEEDEEEDVELDDDDGMEGYSKSGRTDYADTFRADSDIADAIDASAFMEALTAKTTDVLDRQHSMLVKSESKRAHMAKATSGALYQMGMLQKSQSEIINALNERLSLVERQPLPQKSTTGVQPLEKAGQQPGVEQMRKSEVLATLSYMNLVKGIKQVGGDTTLNAIVRLESQRDASAEVLGEVSAFLQANPTEAAAARIYQ
jgi:hypothetical protein